MHLVSFPHENTRSRDSPAARFFGLFPVEQRPGLAAGLLDDGRGDHAVAVALLRLRAGGDIACEQPLFMVLLPDKKANEPQALTADNTHPRRRTGLYT